MSSYGGLVAAGIDSGALLADEDLRARLAETLPAYLSIKLDPGNGTDEVDCTLAIGPRVPGGQWRATATCEVTGVALSALRARPCWPTTESIGVIHDDQTPVRFRVEVECASNGAETWYPYSSSVFELPLPRRRADQGDARRMAVQE